MADNRFDMLGDDNGHEDEAIASLSQLARTHGAESRAADIVAEKALAGRYRFSPALGWLEWDGRRWDADDVAEPRVVETVRQFIDTTERDYRAQAVEAEVSVKAMFETVSARASEDDAKDAKGKVLKPATLVEKLGTTAEVESWNAAVSASEDARQQADMWLNLLSAGKISSITKLCRGMDGIVTRSTAFDAQPDLLNCHNGVVDLRTGELRPADPDLLLTHLAGGEYIPGARSAVWEKALAAVHPAIVEWFQTRMGQSITGYTPDDDTMIVCAGGGSNGKSAVMSGVMRACGTYGRLISHRVLIAQPGQHPTELMDLRGLRFALLEETPEEGHLDTHQLKTTIGTPQITARRMRRDDVTFDTSHTLWVNTNFLPQVDSTDHGTWRRLKAMPWPFKFRKPGLPMVEDNDRPGDLTLKPRLKDDLTVPAAVLAWLVAGAMRWYAAQGVSPQDPEMVATTTATWRSTTDVGFLFATEHLAAAPGHFVTAEVMRKAFEEFLETQGKRAWSAQTFNTRFPDSLAAAGIVVEKTPQIKTKIRQDDTQSHRAVAWSSTPADVEAGKSIRCWRGVRFRSAAEIGQPLAEAI